MRREYYRERNNEIVGNHFPPPPPPPTITPSPPTHFNYLLTEIRKTSSTCFHSIHDREKNARPTPPRPYFTIIAHYRRHTQVYRKPPKSNCIPDGSVSNGRTRDPFFFFLVLNKFFYTRDWIVPNRS